MRPSPLVLTLAVLTVPAAAAALAARPAPAPAPFDRTIRPFLAKYCIACHSGKSAGGGVDLARFTSAAGLKQDPHVWEHVVQKLETRQMPPPQAPQPTPAASRAVTGWIRGELARLEKLAPPDPGRVTARRLNRAEYNNTVRDLLGVDLQPADDFPQDDSGYGFDNIGDVLSLSPALMERYLTAAERLTRTALFGPMPVKPTQARHIPPLERKLELAYRPPAEYDVTGLTLPNAIHVTHRFPLGGEYLIRPVLRGTRPLASEPVKIGVWIDGKHIRTLELDPEGAATFFTDRQDFSGKMREVRVRVPAGRHWVAATIERIYEGLPPRFGGPNPSARPAPPPPDLNRVPPGLTPEQAEEFRRRRRERQKERVPLNEVRVRTVEIEGPYEASTQPSPEAARKIYACGHLDGGHQPGCERKILAAFTRRAFRRPVTGPEVERYTRLFTLAREQGDSFEESLAVALQGVLVSPQFLFRIERDGAAGVHPISQHELATRLSYFLWSTTPDDTLLALADQGRLARPEVLNAQVRRLLQDPRSRALVENFGGQWLELRKLESVRPDRERFDWDEYLRDSMRQETETFLAHVVQEDRSLLDLVDAPYSYLNERLARFYGIPGVRGPEFRRVDLTGTRRGGLLGQASVLTVSSYSTRTSPVLRGKWILDNLLNAPPPPPPPNVPVLDESKVGTAVSLRAQLEEHRKNPTCAACHARLDPLGFALENYDAIGAWREMDGKLAIDTSAKLPDGRRFNGPEELKGILKADADQFTACVAEKLLTYALGRGLERYDRPAVKQIVDRTRAGGYRFSSLALAIVESLPFRMRRAR